MYTLRINNLLLSGTSGLKVRCCCRPKMYIIYNVRYFWIAEIRTLKWRWLFMPQHLASGLLMEQHTPPPPPLLTTAFFKSPNPVWNGGCTLLFGTGWRPNTRQHFRVQIYDRFFQLQVCAFPAKYLIDVASRKL